MIGAAAQAALSGAGGSSGGGNGDSGTWGMSSGGSASWGDFGGVSFGAFNVNTSTGEASSWLPPVITAAALALAAALVLRQ